MFGKILLTLFLFASLAQADLITVSGGATCTGCTVAGPALNYGDSTGLDPISFTIVATSGDVYNATGTTFATYDSNGTAFGVDLNVAYAGTTPTASADSFTVDVFQDFYNAAPGNWDGTYTETTSAGVTAGAGSTPSFTVNLFWDGQAVGLLGPFSSSVANASASNTLTGLDGDTLSGDFQFTYNFSAGTAPGAGAAALAGTPEPAEMLPCAGLALAGLALIRRRRK